MTGLVFQVDDTLKTQMNNFLLSTASQQEIQSLDNKIHETVETINTMKTHREFYLSFARDPQLFINKWLISQSRGKECRRMYPIAGTIHPSIPIHKQNPECN